MNDVGAACAAKNALQVGGDEGGGVPEKGAVERIDRVAIWWKGLCHTAESPRRHHHVIREMAARGLGPECMHHQGFMTDLGRFVDRKEGWKIAKAADQIKRVTGSDGTLFSEDLW